MSPSSSTVEDHAVPALSPESLGAESAAAGFGALSSLTRLRLLSHLALAGEHGMTPSALAETLHVPLATLSFHLKELNQAALVTVRRQGRQRHYRVSEVRVDALREHLRHLLTTDGGAQSQSASDSQEHRLPTRGATDPST